MMKCSRCGGKSWHGEVCFECMETAILAVDPKYLDAERVAGISPIAARSVEGVPPKTPVRVKWGYRPTKNVED